MDGTRSRLSIAFDFTTTCVLAHRFTCSSIYLLIAGLALVRHELPTRRVASTRLKCQPLGHRRATDAGDGFGQFLTGLDRSTNMIHGLKIACDEPMRRNSLEQPPNRPMVSILRSWDIPRLNEKGYTGDVLAVAELPEGALCTRRHFPLRSGKRPSLVRSPPPRRVPRWSARLEPRALMARVGPRLMNESPAPRTSLRCAWALKV